MSVRGRDVECRRPGTIGCNFAVVRPLPRNPQAQTAGVTFPASLGNRDRDGRNSTGGIGPEKCCCPVVSCQFVAGICCCGRFFLLSFALQLILPVGPPMLSPYLADPLTLPILTPFLPLIPSFPLTPPPPSTSSSHTSSEGLFLHHHQFLLAATVSVRRSVSCYYS